ncbi:hypothetical protein PG993_004253 [Apiospora rasikravindrae]|uniref:Protein kinase domain-containing protein n=1 Tax=Apiospora rasikravindrae TaxID=990691 RepID=A0ABR1TC82_9PEZI
MALMDLLTDKPDWSRQISDETIIAEWRKEATEQTERGMYNEIVSKEGDSADNPRYYPQCPPGKACILSEAAFNFVIQGLGTGSCLDANNGNDHIISGIQELRAKAVYFEQTGLVPTLDTNPSGMDVPTHSTIPRVVAKSDHLVTPEFHARLMAALEGLCIGRHQIAKAILSEPDSIEQVNYSCEESIRTRLKDTGLQVVVKVASIELAPEKPNFVEGRWHVCMFTDQIARGRLVEPYERIISTGNVPPPQPGWWADAVFGSDPSVHHGDLRPEVFQLLTEKLGPQVQRRSGAETGPSSENSKTLPPKLLDMLRHYRGVGGDGLMGSHEARKHRIRLMDERPSGRGADEGGYNSISDPNMRALYSVGVYLWSLLV